MIVVRRAAAWAVDFAIFTAVLFVLLWRDERTDWLYAYNGVRLGNALIIVLACIMAGIMNETLGDRAFRLKVRTVEGTVPPVSRRVVRAFFLWLIMLQALYPSVRPTRLGVEGMVGLDLGLASMSILLPAIWVIASRGRVGPHDALTAVRVTLDGQEQVERVRLSKLVGFTLISFSMISAASAALAWEYGVAPTTTGRWGYVRDRNVNIIEPYYRSPDKSVQLKGTSVHMTGSTALANVVDANRAKETALQILLKAQRLLPPSTKWVEIELDARKDLGYAEWGTTTRVLIQLPGQTVMFPPHLEPTKKLHRGGFKLDSFPVGYPPVARTVYFTQVIDKFFGANLGPMSSLSFNLLASRQASLRDDLAVSIRD